MPNYVPAIPRRNWEKHGERVSVLDFGATRGGACLFDAAMTAGDNTLTSASASFTTTDVGKLLKVYDAGPGQFSPHLFGLIKSVTDAHTIRVGDFLGADLPADRDVTDAQAIYAEDNTAKFQAALDASNGLMIPFGIYGIVGPLVVRPGTRIYGECKGAGLFSPGGSGPGTAGAALGSCLVNFSDTDFAFEYLSDGTFGQIQDGFLFERMTIVSKRGIRINNPTVAIAAQSYIHPVTARDILFQGDYDYDNDPESWTSTLPTATGSANSLDQYGVAFAGRKLLRCELKDCTFYNYGIAVWMCDWSQSSIRHCRLVHGGIFVWASAAGFDSNRNKIVNSEIIEFSRKGAIYIEYTSMLLIQGNWFEQNSAANLTWLAHENPTYIWSDFDDGLTVCENAFLDNYSLTAPLYRISPRVPALIFGNIYGSSGLTQAFAEMDRSHYEATNRAWSTAPLKIFGNDTGFPIPQTPNVVRSTDNNPYKFSYNEPANIGGAPTASDPWMVSPVTGDWVVRTDIAGFIWLPPIQSPAHRDFRCAVTARFLDGDPFFVAVYLFSKVASIIGMSSTAPIVVETSGAHGLTTGDVVFIKDFLAADFTGFPGAGIATITVTDATHFSLDGSDGTTGGTYSQGGEVYERTLLEVFNPGITKITGMETGYFQFGLPDSLAAKTFLGIDTTNDLAEIYSIELFPFADGSRVFRARDEFTGPLAQWQSYAGVDQAAIESDGRLSIPTFLSGVQFKTANYTVLKTDRYIGVSTAIGPVTLSLPTIATTFDAARGLGQSFVVKWINGSNSLTIDPNGTELIEGASTFTFSSLGDAVVIQNDGDSWKVVARYTVLEGVWRWVTVNTSIRTDFQVGINKDPGASIFLDVAGITRSDLFRSTGWTAGKPICTDGSKDLVTTLIDLADAVNFITGVLSVAHGGTGATTAAGAAINLDYYLRADIDSQFDAVWAELGSKATAGASTGTSAGHSHTQV